MTYIPPSDLRKMARLLPLLLAATTGQEVQEVKHVRAGREYLNSPRQSKQLSTLFGEDIPEENYRSCKPQGSDPRSFSDFTFEDIEKLNNISFSDPEYKDKVLLVVNVAGFWGYTPQYYSLNALAEKYADRPFKILGFPCNQFLRQEPGANASEIYATLKHIRPGDGFVPNFDMFAKSDVNGENQNPIYEFLKSRCPSVREEFQASYKLYYEPKHQNDIRWNFEKFLIDHSGQPVRRYDEALEPLEIVPDIDVMINKCELDRINGA